MPDALLSIGKVREELLREFPTITISQIRYYEDQGLLHPERTASGYRKFAYGDIERVRFILRQQKAPHFWPLSHIRAVLDQVDNGEVPDTDPAARPKLRLADDGLPTAETFTAKPSQQRLTRQDLLEKAGIEASLLDELEQHGIIERRPAQKFYDGDDLAVATMAADFAALGVEPRHLRAFRTSADREAALIDQVRGDDTASLAALSVRMHTLLLRRRLRG